MSVKITMPKINRKTLLGLTSLTVFLLLLIQLSGGLPFSQYKYYFQNLGKFLVEKRQNSQAKETRVHKLVEIHKLLDEESSIINVVENASSSVVSVVVKQVNYDFFSGPSLTEAGIGTGFIVDPNGVIVTNSHVVSDQSGEYSVILKDGTTYEVEKIHLDQTSDLAIIEITARDLPALELADSDQLKVGQKTIAIGNALGKFQNTVTSGIVSGIGREITASAGYGTQASFYEEVIQTDAALNPGNSGGPLLNLSGQVIGINVATTPSADNISFAIPSNTLRPLLETFLAKGRIIRPYLGVSYQIVTAEISRLRELPQGAFVSRIYEDSPAEKAELKRGDIITAFDGLALDEKNTLARLINQSSVGKIVELKIDREGKSMTLYATLVESPESL
jgi:serine protease Do